MRYRLRCFYSKGAFLVLLWITLESLASWSFFRSYKPLYSGLYPGGWLSQIAILPLVPFLAFAPLAGWLADSKFGNFKVFKFGAVLLLLSVLISSMCTILISNVNSWASVLSSAVVPIAYTLWLVGLAACLVTALQLGLDQMPDASTMNKISFINWFFFSVTLGLWVYDSLWNLLHFCTVSNSNQVINQVLSLLPVLSMSIVCCTVFLLAPKWLIVEPKSSQALKTIYKVLKFAAKHKAPLNRSALTYWEEDMPSRLDLGKSRFGGPFTTEQVEDVKTFFKIIVIHLPWFIFTLPFQWDLLFRAQTVAGLDNCQSHILYCFTYSPLWCLMLTVLFGEFVVYPLVRMKLPSILRRIGIVCFVAFLVNAGYLLLYAVNYTHHLQLFPWTLIIFPIYFGSFDFQFKRLLTVQFVCAQSPYNMRGLLTGYSVFLQLVSIGVGVVIIKQVSMLNAYKDIIEWSLVTGLNLVGFILHCVLAHWYKRRVRDEEYNAHRVVEEVYDRYLSQYH